MNSVILGELAALGTALCWSLSGIFFTLAGRRVGSLVVNRARLTAALLLVGATHLLLMGQLLPVDAGVDRWFWFGLSAVVGFVLGDGMLFQSYLMIGTRIGLLLMSLNPVFGALLAWLLLGETLSPAEVIAMLLALGGATWVVLERTEIYGQPQARGRTYYIGVALALGAAVCQALALIIAKRGLAGEFSPLSALLMRLVVAVAAIWLLAIFSRQARPTLEALWCDRRADLAILGGAFVGPFLGVWLSLIAVQNVRIGIASTLMGMSPVILLPLVRWFYGEHISRRAVAGTVVAVAGVAAMFLV